MRYIQRIEEDIPGEGRVVSTPGVLFFPKENGVSKTYTVIDGGGPGVVDGVIDLSYRTYDGILSRYRNTANCYIVYACGTFMIPCVYGNAIKDGLTNTAAFTNNGATYSTDFVNHLGNTITNPWIESNTGCSPSAAMIVWQDSPAFINNLQLITSTDSRKYLQFEINEIPVTNANAIIAVTDGTDILWSWHIWGVDYTDPIRSETLVNHTNVEYNLMTVSLGWKWDDSTKAHGKCCHYQWGRKDPMPCPSAYNSSSTIALTGSKSYKTAAAATIADSIKNPNVFYLQDGETYYNWFTGGSKYNLWNANCTGTGASDNQDSIIKTVYDPSPFGWELPAGRAWTGFTTTGGNTEDSTQFNVVGSWNSGWTFKKDSSDTTGTYYPASGYRSRESGSLYTVSSHGRCWSCASNSQTYAYLLRFRSGYVYPLYSDSRAYGFAVRPSRS